MQQKAVRMYMRPLNIYKAVNAVEVMGKRDSTPGRFPKPFACGPSPRTQGPLARPLVVHGAVVRQSRQRMQQEETK